MASQRFGSFGGFERPHAASAPMSEINVTPLVDVMMVLLVIFIITAPLMVSALKLELPKTEGAAAPNSQPRLVKVGIDAQGVVYWDDKDKPQALSLEALKQRLRKQSALALDAQREPPELQLRADARVPYGRVAEVMGLAQSAGMSRIGFVTERQTP